MPDGQRGILSVVAGRKVPEEGVDVVGSKLQGCEESGWETDVASVGIDARCGFADGGLILSVVMIRVCT